MSEKQPLVSVIIPCYNHEKYIAYAIESVLNQTYKNIEVIVADNGSTDGSYDVIQQYADRITAIQLQINNPFVCEKKLTEAAHGEYIAHMTSDDYWEPDKLELQMKVFSDNSHVKVCTTWALFCNEELNPFDTQEGNPFLLGNYDKDELFRILFYRDNVLAYPSAVVERQLWLSLVKERKGYYQLADYYCWIMSALRGEIYIVNQPLVLFRWHTSGVNANASAPTAAVNARTAAERSQITRKTIEEMSDEDFKRIFIKPQCETHEHVLCEKLFTLVELNKMKGNMLGDAVLGFYYNHYIEMIPVLEEKYSFTFADAQRMCGEIAGLQQYNELREMLQKEIGKSQQQEKQISSLKKVLYSSIQSEDQYNLIRRRLFEELSDDTKKVILLLYRVLSNLLVNEWVNPDINIYVSLVSSFSDVTICLEMIIDELNILDISVSLEELDLFKNLVRLCQREQIDLQEGIFPFLKHIHEQLSTLLL